MIELYYWPTPNGHKITMFLEEADLSYRIHPVDISAGDQFKPEFLRISPNNRRSFLREGLRFLRVIPAMPIFSNWRQPCRASAAQKRWLSPARMVRRGPNCGAPTPTPVPLRI
jgi:Glutathione S-transferase, N-terminal domain